MCHNVSVVKRAQPEGSTLVARVGPLVLLHHPWAPDATRALEEYEAIEGFTRSPDPPQVRALLAVLGELTPPPPFTALRHYRHLVEHVEAIEFVAVVIGEEQGFGETIALAVLRQLVHLTRMSERVETFRELGPALRRLSAKLDGQLDVNAAVAALAELRMKVQAADVAKQERGG